MKFRLQNLTAGWRSTAYAYCYCCDVTYVSRYSRTPLIWINWDGEPSGYAEIPDNSILLWEQAAFAVKFGCYYLQYLGRKVKRTLVQTLRLCTGRTAHRGSRGIALLFLDHRTRRGEGSASRPGGSLPSGKTRYSLYRRLGGPQGRSGQVRKISPPTGIRSPDLPARSQSLYRLRYPAHIYNIHLCLNPSTTPDLQY